MIRDGTLIDAGLLCRRDIKFIADVCFCGCGTVCGCGHDGLCGLWESCVIVVWVILVCACAPPCVVFVGCGADDGECESCIVCLPFCGIGVLWIPWCSVWDAVCGVFVHCGCGVISLCCECIAICAICGYGACCGLCDGVSGCERSEFYCFFVCVACVGAV